jgi:hypothetical protein
MMSKQALIVLTAIAFGLPYAWFCLWWVLPADDDGNYAITESVAPIRRLRAEHNGYGSDEEHYGE